MLSGLLIQFLGVLSVLVTVIYLYVRYCYNYWKNRGVPFLKPSFPFGNYGPIFMQKETLGVAFQEIYKKCNKPFVGIYAVLTPNLIVCDPKIAQNMLIRDFQYFDGRGFYMNEKTDPLSKHLFALNGKDWTFFRQKLTPAFTPGKMKMMFPTFLDVTKPLERFLRNKAERNEPFEAHDLFARYTTDIIGSVGFGVDVNSIEDPNITFRLMGKKFFDATFMNAVRNALMFLAPSLMKLLKIKFVDRETEEFMLFLVKKTLEYREKTSTTRKDFMQLLIELKITGQIKADTVDKEINTIPNNQITNGNNNNNNNNNNSNIVKNGNKLDSKEWSIEEITAQAFVFFIAGFETASTAISFCMFELASHPDIQTKVQKEIDEILAANEGEFTYEGMTQMKYLDAVIEETVRKHPPLSFLNRQCNKDYKIPDTDVTIEKGVNVIFPSLAFQNDEKFYKNPEQFLPERFLKSKRNFVEAPFMPFGEGPRICIAMKLGHMQVKVGLMTLLKNFTFKFDDCMSTNLGYNPKSIVLNYNGGIHLKISER